MSWRFSGPNLSGITKLLSKPDTTVEMILDEPALTTALRNNLQALISFFVDNHDNNSHLIDLVLTDIVPDTKLPAKTTRCAVQVLTSSSAIINKSKLLFQRLVDFPQSQFAKNQRCCANYCQIVENIARYTSGQSLSKLTTLKEFLMKDMNNIALCELFVVLATDHHQNWIVTEQMLNEMLSDPNTPNNFYIIRAIDNMTKSKQKVNRQLFRLICQIEIVKKLLAIAKNDSLRPAINIEAFMLLERMIKEMSPNEELKKLIETEAASYNFTLERPEAVISAALRVFITKDDSIILKVFSNTGTYFRKGILRSLTNMPQEDLQAIAQRADLIKLFMAEFPKNTYNGHLIPIADVLDGIAKSTEGWSDFYTNVVKTRAEKMSCQFGGEHPPSAISDAEEDDDDDGEGFAGTRPACDDVDTEQLFSSSESSSSSDEDIEYIRADAKKFSSSSGSDSDSSDDGEILFKPKGDSALKSESDDSDDVFGLSKDKGAKLKLADSSSDSDSDSDDLKLKTPSVFPAAIGLPPPVLPNPTLPTPPPLKPDLTIFSAMGNPGLPPAMKSSDSDSSSDDDSPSLQAFPKKLTEAKVPPFPGADATPTPVHANLPPFPGLQDSTLPKPEGNAQLPPFPGTQPSEIPKTEGNATLPPFPKSDSDQLEEKVLPPFPSASIPQGAPTLPPFPGLPKENPGFVAPPFPKKVEEDSHDAPAQDEAAPAVDAKENEQKNDNQ
ncbi:hypothetical protein TVAG_088780 [Trichomonas vaginalis G3]|uniref:Uncharacterized protein n=1 Tax=Trichomonas vaginalis (strain ATCC PRA-98 / G3) TaxID=412133 RepID=A2EB23_TRIV3|nr:serine/threonine-protein phosphatase 6 regulatory subunit family [Trichomonas vaginalis G3]EAY10163.1 hypothetical protein TVAG_088780 [Trichomonas vaginalis G3]KAI5534463.1 serine/threonine-protein phosphatase 6 regulatory subunit family [Trichomonas vaginalis G3]|eukprot:XP_001322386.1 hypothetical protein [Trichomonas vaginalis G3]